MTFEERCRLSEQCLPEAPYREMLTKLHNEMLEAQPAPVQEPEYRCCPHDSDCAVHNMPAYPARPCDCSYSNTFNLPSSSLVHEVCLKLADRELEKLTNENFGRTPNDTWTNKIVDVYYFFDSNPKAKKLTEIYTTQLAQQQWVGLTDEEVLSEAKRFALGISFPFNGVTTPEMFARAIEAKLKEKNT